MNKNNLKLIPGNLGKDCPYNGEHEHEMACDECDYLMCCIDKLYPETCINCSTTKCPRKVSN